MELLRKVFIICLILVCMVTKIVKAGSERYRCPSTMPNAGYIYEYDEKCYQFILEEKTWNEAKNWCYQYKGAMVNTDTWARWNWVVNVLVNTLGSVFDNNGFWIGLHDRFDEGNWLWDEGPGKSDTSPSWTNWYPGEPNDWTGQDCVYMRRGYDWKWVDVGCDGGIGRTYAYACEYDMLPKTTTTTKPTTTTTTTPTTTTRPTTTTTPTTTPTTTTKATTTTTPTTTPTTTTKATTTTTPTTTTRTTTKPTTTTTITTTTTSTRATNTTTTTTTTSPPLEISTSTVTDMDPPSTALVQSTATNMDKTEGIAEKTTPTPLSSSTNSTKAIIVIPSESGVSGKIGKASEVKAHNEADHTSKYVGTTVGLLILVLIAIVIIVILVMRRRKQKDELLTTLSNPCYIDDPRNRMSCGDSDDYATCRIESNGNVYVEIGDDKKTNGGCHSAPNMPSHSWDDLAFSNQRYMVAENDQTQNLEAELPKGRPATKYLDEYGPYDHDGYMVPKHVYADPEELTSQELVPPQRLTGLYSEPGPVYSTPVPGESSFVYVDVQDDTEIIDLRDNPIYETPHNNQQLNTGMERRALAASEYDVPRNIKYNIETDA